MKKLVKRHEVVQPLNTSYRLIPLTQGQNAIVDENDFAWLSQWNWFAKWDARMNGFYAERNCIREKTGERYRLGMHRVVLACKEGEKGDHRNHNTLDNRRNNLRKSTHSENICNSSRRRDNTSGFKGVTFHKATGKWCAQIRLNGKLKHLGLFQSPDSAGRAYDIAAKKLHGEFAFLNFQ